MVKKRTAKTQYSKQLINMYQFKTNTDTPFTVDYNGIVKTIGNKKYVSSLYEIRLSQYIIKWLVEEETTYSFILDLIDAMGNELPSTTYEFEKMIKQKWKYWLTQGWVIENDMPYYSFDEKIAAFDMRDYYGNKSKRRGILRKRYDIAIPKVQVLIKDAELAHLWKHRTINNF